MSYFINRMGFGFDQFSILESFFLKEETNIISRFFKVLIKIVFSTLGIKDSNFIRSYLKVFNQTIDLLDGLCTFFVRNEVWDDSVSIFPVELQCFCNHLFFVYFFKKRIYKVLL